MKLPTSLQLETHRLRLRMPSQEDIPHIFSATRYKGFNDGMLWEPPKDPSELVSALARNLNAWEKGEGYAFSIENKQSKAFLGRISIRKTAVPSNWNIGFWTHPIVQNQGIMSEAVQAILQFGFTQLHAARIEAAYATWNIASEKVLQKNGLKFVRHIEKGFFKNGQWTEENLLAIDREDFVKRSS